VAGATNSRFITLFTGASQEKIARRTSSCFVATAVKGSIRDSKHSNTQAQYNRTVDQPNGWCAEICVQIFTLRSRPSTTCGIFSSRSLPIRPKDSCGFGLEHNLRSGHSATSNPTQHVSCRNHDSTRDVKPAQRGFRDRGQCFPTTRKSSNGVRTEVVMRVTGDFSITGQRAAHDMTR
jgi:hypothetical protein